MTDKKYTLQVDDMTQEELQQLLTLMKNVFDEDSNWDVQAYDSDEHMIIVMSPSPEKEEEKPKLSIVEDETKH